MKRGDQGVDVRELQQALMELGYDLPRWGADGDLGSETLAALSRVLRDHGAEADEDADVVSDAALALVQNVLASTKAAPLGPKLEDGRFHDLRSIASQILALRQQLAGSLASATRRSDHCRCGSLALGHAAPHPPFIDGQLAPIAVVNDFVLVMRALRVPLSAP